MKNLNNLLIPAIAIAIGVAFAYGLKPHAKEICDKAGLFTNMKPGDMQLPHVEKLIEGIKTMGDYAKWDARYEPLWNPTQKVSSHNIRVILIFLRYMLGIGLVILGFRYPLFLFLFTLGFFF